MFAMGNEDLGVKYDTEDGKPICIIYEHGQVATKVPVTSPPYLFFEVRDHRLFWCFPGFEGWFETTRFWMFSTHHPNTLTDWKVAELLARIEGNEIAQNIVPIRCRECNSISTVNFQSNCANRQLCIGCLSKSQVDRLG